MLYLPTTFEKDWPTLLPDCFAWFSHRQALKCISENFVILYADDTVIMSETKEDLQKQLDVFSEYCKFWQLKVNVEKTKILVFSRGRLPNNLTFTFNEMEIGIVSEFNYLGVLFSKSGNFSMAKKSSSKESHKSYVQSFKKRKNT